MLPPAFAGWDCGADCYIYFSKPIKAGLKSVAVDEAKTKTAFQKGPDISLRLLKQ